VDLRHHRGSGTSLIDGRSFYARIKLGDYLAGINPITPVNEQSIDDAIGAAAEFHEDVGLDHAIEFRHLGRGR
jgi:hypothetical protein